MAKNFVVDIFNRVSQTSSLLTNIIDFLMSGLDAVWTSIKISIVDIVKFLIDKLNQSLGKKLSAMLGIDDTSSQLERWSSDLVKEFEVTSANASKAFENMSKSFFGDNKSGAMTTFDQYEKLGKQRMAEAMGVGGAIMAGPNFLADLAEQNAKERKEALDKLTDRAKDLASKEDGEIKLSIGIKQLRSDRFRKVRKRR
jgi:hypothetical protein